jgi:hypothetical protein
MRLYLLSFERALHRCIAIERTILVLPTAAEAAVSRIYESTYPSRVAFE